MKILLMYNPKAGKQNFSLDSTVSRLEESGAEVTSQNTKKKGYHKILKDTFDFVIIAGGDGTVGKVVKRIVENPVPLAILPMGSANNFASSMETDEMISNIILGWKYKDFRNFRIGSANLGKKKKLFLESVGWGLFEKVLSEQKKKKSKKKKGDAKVESGINKMVAKIDEMKPSAYDVFLDGLDYSGDYLWIEIMNTHVMGPKLPIAPGANPEDDYLEIVLVKKNDKEKLEQFLSEQKTDENNTFFNSLRAKTIKIGTQESTHIDSDVVSAKKMKTKLGEMLEISLLPQSLHIINSNK